jgi:hypothetical protein
MPRLDVGRTYESAKLRAPCFKNDSQLSPVKTKSEPSVFADTVFCFIHTFAWCKVQF